MAADYTVVQGDTLPVLTDTLTYSNGEAANLEGATLKLVMRSLQSNTQFALTGAATATAAKEGKVQFAPTEADTSFVGNYAANWQVVFPGGKKMTFPTVGYLWLQVQENLTTEGGATLVSLGELKDYLNIPATDRAHDEKLIEHIEAITPLIEEEIGPVIPRIYDEVYDGGNNVISLLNAPTFGWGATPVLTLLGVSEFRGPIEYPLSIVQNPVGGSIYSVELDPRNGVLTRRTAGGGVIPFMPGRNSVHAVYRAGQEAIQRNVTLAAKETIRVNYQTTQAVGRGRRAVSDEEEFTGPPMGFFLPRRAKDLLQPMRRAPSIF